MALQISEAAPAETEFSRRLARIDEPGFLNIESYFVALAQRNEPGFCTGSRRLSSAQRARLSHGYCRLAQRNEPGFLKSYCRLAQRNEPGLRKSSRRLAQHNEPGLRQSC